MSIVSHPILTEISRIIQAFQVFCITVPLLQYDSFCPSTLLFIFHRTPQPSTLHSLLYYVRGSFEITVASFITSSTSFAVKN